MKKYKSYKDDKTGIYLIRNIANGKFYVGSSNEIYRRWAAHKRDLKNQRHDNQHLQNAWNKYGKESFELIIVEILNTYEKPRLLQLEQKYLDECYGKNECYNLSNLAAGGSTSKRSKRDWEVAHRKEIYRSLKSFEGKELLINHHLDVDCVYDDVLWAKRCRLLKEKEAKRKQSFNTGNTALYQNRGQNISKAKLGGHHSEETKKKISQMMKLNGANTKPKLTIDQRKQLKTLYTSKLFTQRQLATQFGIHPSSVSSLIKNPKY